MASCSANPSINWLIHSDCNTDIRRPPNVRLVNISWKHYQERISDTLGLRYSPITPLSICDLRPAFGRIYETEIRNFDYFGWGDIDVIYGDIRNFYDEAVLSTNAISADPNICSGHLMLLKNEEWLRDAFRLIPGWRSKLERPEPGEWRDCLDEAHLSGILSSNAQARGEFRSSGEAPVPSLYWDNNYFKDQWVTPFVPKLWHDGRWDHPERWYWRKGRMMDDRHATRHYLYLHLMNFKAKRYVNEHLYADSATWDSLTTKVEFGPWPDSISEMFISRAGVCTSP